jgi:glycosyltransferase involved in cell wall biosynthesis
MDQIKGRRITFLTTGDIRKIATMKRALGMANHLADLGWNVSIVVMDCMENRARIRASCDQRIEVRYFTEGNAFSERRQKSNIIRTLDPDVLYCCSYSFRNRSARRDIRQNCRLVVEHSELTSAILGLPKLKRWLYKYYEWLSVRRSDMIVAASRWLQQYYLDRVQQSGRKDLPVTYLPYAQDIDLKSIDADEVSKLRLQYDNSFNIVFLGSMIRNYGLFLMLEACVKLRDAELHHRLHLIGDGPDLLEAREYVAFHGISDMVIFTGYLPEERLGAYLQLADAFLAPLYPTIQDQARCPSKTYLYLPFRKPVLTCRIGESAEIFTDERLFFRSADSSDLADKIKALQKNMTYPLPDPVDHTWEVRAANFHRDMTAAWKD